MSKRLIPTIWDGNGIQAGWNASDDFLLQVYAALGTKDPRIQIHTTDPGYTAGMIRKCLPNVEFVVGCGVDWIARPVALGTKSQKWGVNQFAELAGKAFDAGARTIVWNAESSWKRPPNSEESKRLDGLIREMQNTIHSDFAAMQQWHTSFDHPTYHSTYPWKAWLGPDAKISRSMPQVYAAPGDGLMAHRGALPRREANALKSWVSAVRAGWIKADAPTGTPADLTDVDWSPYYQLHSVTFTDTVSSSMIHLEDSNSVLGYWALRSRSDFDGRRAFAGCLALEKLGYQGRSAILDFQKSVGLKADGVYGPITERALFDKTGIKLEWCK